MSIAANSIEPLALQQLVMQLENDPSLLEPHRLRQRLEALDCLDAQLAFASTEPCSTGSGASDLRRRIKTLSAKLDSINAEIYEVIRAEILRGRGADALLRWAQPQAGAAPRDSASATISADRFAYDYLDDLLSGILRLDEPAAPGVPPDQEMVAYQPTPARHIFDLLRITELSEADVLVDLGSGLGHVLLLAAICTQARCIGVERESAYVQRTRQCARSLNLNNIVLCNQDVREADLSDGTLFYLYTPFIGTILAAVLERLRREAATRGIRICTYGPVTGAIVRESWLRAASTPRAGRITLFHSRD